MNIVTNTIQVALPIGGANFPQTEHLIFLAGFFLFLFPILLSFLKVGKNGGPYFILEAPLQILVDLLHDSHELN